MQGTRAKSKRYFVSKHFYRFIRPGAKMLGVNYKEEDGVFVSAYEHKEMGAFVMVMINSTDKPVKTTIEGNSIPGTFEMYLTTASENCVNKGTINTTALSLPPLSIVTLVNGKVLE
jgi:O-glycosyl hydrolase